MSRALSLSILADTKPAQLGVKQLSTALDDVDDTLDDLASEAQRSGRKLERALDDVGGAGTDAARDVVRGGEKMERTFRELVTDAGKAERAVDKIGDGAGKAMGTAADYTGEFKQEALSNFSEVVSSFDGSMSSVVDLAQGTLGGLAGTGLPGVAIAAGIAAGSVGLIGAAFEGNTEQEEAAVERAGAWADAYIEAGDRIIGAAHIVAEVQRIATSEAYDEAKQNAEDWGVDVSTAMRALAGDATALAVVQGTLADRSAEAAKLLAEQETQTTSAAGAAFDLADSVDRGQDALARLNGEMEAGQERADNAADALREYAESAEGATEQTDEFGNRLITLPDETQVVISAETGRATTDVKTFKGEVDALPSQPVVTRVKVEVDDRAWRDWRPGTKVGRVDARVGGLDAYNWE